MTSSIPTLLIVAFASLVLGVVVGLLVNSLRSEPEEKSETGSDTPPGGRPGGYVPVVKLWREKTTETLVVEVEGKSYVSPAPLSLAQRENLERVLAQLSGWLGVTVVASPDQVARPPLPAQPVASQHPDIPSHATAVRVETVQPVAAVPPPVSAVPVSWSPAKPAGQPAPKEEPKSIVGQIDEILQEMLVKEGLDNRGIALNEDPRRGVIVSIGVDRYEGIDSVSDVEVKKILRAAVSEWERRQERPQH